MLLRRPTRSPLARLARSPPVPNHGSSSLLLRGWRFEALADEDAIQRSNSPVWARAVLVRAVVLIVGAVLPMALLDLEHCGNSFVRSLSSCTHLARECVDLP